MSMNDPISDLLTRIRNAVRVEKETVRIPFSKIKCAILDVLIREGFVKKFEVLEEDSKKNILIYLKYAHGGRPVINSLKRVSKNGCRIYQPAKSIQKILNGVGISIVTTPKGLLSDRECREKNVGGEVLCEVY